MSHQQQQSQANPWSSGTGSASPAAQGYTQQTQQQQSASAWNPQTNGAQQQPAYAVPTPMYNASQQQYYSQTADQQQQPTQAQSSQYQQQGQQQGSGIAPTSQQQGAQSYAYPQYQTQPQQQAQAQVTQWQQQQAAAQAQNPWGSASYASNQQQQPAQQSYYASTGAAPPQLRTWTGIVTGLIPPNYGIVDGDAFYVDAVVQGRLPKVGESVLCEAIPNTDGGQYAWRCAKVEASSATASSITSGGAPAVVTSIIRPGSIIPRGRPIVNIKGNIPVGSSLATAKAGHAAASQAHRGSSNQNGGGTESEGSRKYNSAPPPTIAYTTDVAMAVAANATDNGYGTMTPPPAVLASIKASIYSRPSIALSDEEARRSEVAVQQFAGFGDPSGIGAKLLSKMGFGAAEGSKGGLGRNEQGISCPVDPKSSKGQSGLGFPIPELGSRRGGFGSAADRPGAGGRNGSGRSGDMREGRGRDRGRDRSKSRSPRKKGKGRSRSSSSSGSSSRSRSRSPRGDAKGSSGGRYSVKPPKFYTHESTRGLASISKRYRDMYIPSDFCRVHLSWLTSLPDHRPLPLHNAVNIIVLPTPAAPATSAAAAAAAEPAAAAAAAEAAPAAAAAEAAVAADGGDPSAMMNGSSLDEGTTAAASAPSTSVVAATSLVPMIHATAVATTMSDAAKATGRRWHAKVVLLSGLPARALFAEDAKSYQHPMRKMQLLVGRKSTSDLCLLGGPWDPQDGPHPESDPSVLTRTAARCFKQQTGVDLSHCTQWTEFCELIYKRCPKSSPDTEVDEHVIVFLVDASTIAKPYPAALETIRKAATLVSAVERAQRVSAEAEGSLKIAEAALVVALRSRVAAVDGAAADVETLVAECSAAVEAAAARAKESKDARDEATAAGKEASRILKEPPVSECIEVCVPPEVATRSKLSAACYSLESLVDYNEDDTKEATFEVSVFAELFREMLQTRYGRALLRALPPLKAALTSGKADAPVSKKQKPANPPLLSSGGKSADQTTPETTTTAPPSSAPSLSSSKAPQPPHTCLDLKSPVESQEGSAAAAAAAAADSGTVKQEVKESSDIVMGEVGQVSGSGTPAPIPTSSAAAAVHCPAPEPLLSVCRFFDEKCAGYLEAEDIEEILYMVAPDISRRRVQSLVDGVCGKKGKLSYPDFASIPIPLAPLPGARMSSHAAASSCHSPGGLHVGSSKATATPCELGPSGTVTVHGVTINVLAMQENLRIADATRTERERAVLQLTAQVADSRAAETTSRENATLLTREITALRASLAVLSADKSGLQSTFSSALGELSAAQTRLAEASRLLQTLGSAASC